MPFLYSVHRYQFIVMEMVILFSVIYLFNIRRHGLPIDYPAGKKRIRFRKLLNNNTITVRY